MEGDISKHNSTESVGSVSSHFCCMNDDLLELTDQMADCLSVSHQIINDHNVYSEQIYSLRMQIECLQAQTRTNRLKQGFVKCNSFGVAQQSGFFDQKKYSPVVLKLNN